MDPAATLHGGPARRRACATQSTNVLRGRLRPLLATACLLFAVWSPPISAQNISPDTSTRRPAAPVSPASPRAAVQQFLRAASAGRYEEAARHLDLPDSAIAAGQGPGLARQLEAILDRRLPLDLESISGLAAGDPADGFVPDVEHLGSIAGPEGVRPVRMTRIGQGQDAVWRFSQSTIEQVPLWFSTLSDRWMIEHLPAPLLGVGPLGILWWQWLALPLLFVLILGIAKLLGRVVTPLANSLVSRTPNRWDDAILARIEGPVSAALSLTILALVLPLLSLRDPAADSVYRFLRASYFVLFFWALWRLIDVVRDVVAASHWAGSAASSRALVPLAARVFKVIVIAVAAVAVLSMFGYPVASLVAGLGLGGLAFALGAQKTLENLFGAFAIGTDQPFREGDFIRVDGIEGTVERIGLRSTRIRTLDRTLITLPNGRLADMRVESLSARDRFRLATTVGLNYETTTGQIRAVLAGFEAVLRAQPTLSAEPIIVRLRALSDSSLTIEIMAWFESPDYDAFRVIRQEVLLEFMNVVESAGSSIAFPTRTVRLVGPPPAPPTAR
jgi:MscS family membrane protein